MNKMSISQILDEMLQLETTLKSNSFKETLSISFFGPLTEKEKVEAWSLYREGVHIVDIAKKLNKEPWIVNGYIGTKEYCIEQPDPGKRLADIHAERGQELALKVAKVAKEKFSKDLYVENSIQNINEVLEVIKDTDYEPNSEDWRILEKYQYRMDIARKMLEAGSIDNNEICKITEILQEDLEKIKENLDNEK